MIDSINAESNAVIPASVVPKPPDAKVVIE